MPNDRIRAFIEETNATEYVLVPRTRFIEQIILGARTPTLAISRTDLLQPYDQPGNRVPQDNTRPAN